MSTGGAAAVVHVHAEHVAGAVQGPAGVDLGLRVERLLGRDRQQARSVEPVGEHLHRGVVGGEERHAGADGVDAGLLGGVARGRRARAAAAVKRAVDRQRAGDVGGVEVVALDAHVEQHQLAGRDRAGVVDPVQRRGVRAAAARSSRSRCRCPSRGRGGRRCPRSSARRTRSTRSHSRTESSKPSVVMSQASWSSPTSHSSLTRRSSEATRREVLVGGDVAGLAVVVEGRQVVDVAHLEAEGVGDLLQRRTAAGPQLAVLPVAEELVGVARGARTGVEDGLAVVDHQHGVAGLVAGEVGVRGVGAEAVVGVVGAHLVGAGREHQPLARERLGELRAALRPHGRRPGARGRSSSRSPQPVRMNAAYAAGTAGSCDSVLRLGAGSRSRVLGSRLAHARHCTPGQCCGSRTEGLLG